MALPSYLVRPAARIYPSHANGLDKEFFAKYASGVDKDR